MNNKLLAIALSTGLAGIGGVANAADYEVTVQNVTTATFFTPLIAAAHTPDAAMFTVGGVASPQLQAIAEGGDISGMATLLESIGASVATGGGLLLPGASETLTVTTSDTNSVLSLSSMLLPTNDGFFGLDSVNFPQGAGQSITFRAAAYDAGTEGNDEVAGSGAPGEAGFPVPPPQAATGQIGSGATGLQLEAEGIIHPHRGVLGDLDLAGGFSDIDASIHRFADTVALITVTRMGGGDDASADAGGDSGAGDSNGPSTVSGLNGVAYSRTAVEIFWEPAVAGEAAIVGYEVRRDGDLVESRDAQSFYENGLNAGVEYRYQVRAIDANGNAGDNQSVVVTTNAN